MDPTQLFQALSNQTRLRCLSLIASADELCVCELTQALDPLPAKRDDACLGPAGGDHNHRWHQPKGALCR